MGVRGDLDAHFSRLKIIPNSPYLTVSMKTSHQESSDDAKRLRLSSIFRCGFRNKIQILNFNAAAAKFGFDRLWVAAKLFDELVWWAWDAEAIDFWIQPDTFVIALCPFQSNDQSQLSDRFGGGIRIRDNYSIDALLIFHYGSNIEAD